MNIFIKETLYLLDYNDNILDTLFVSTDKKTAGYIYDIQMKEYNTGHSDLTFKIPSCIINEKGESIKNPKLEQLKPLSKIRYNRIITYMGKEKVSIPTGGDTIETYPKNDGLNPEDYEMENYVMDYIIEPLNKDRNGIGIYLTYTAIDFPRFNLSKKRMGLTFNEKTVTEQGMSLYKNRPLSIPGQIQYIPWSNELAGEYQAVGQVFEESNLKTQNAEPGDLYFVVLSDCLYEKQEDGSWLRIEDDNTKLTTWEPNPQNGKYPIDENTINKLLKTVSMNVEYTYGQLATIYYWPVTKTARFYGVRYEEGGFITLSLYNTYAGSDWTGSDYLNNVTWEWGYLQPMKHYLSPNNACNYLRYIVKDTNWSVKGDAKSFIKNTEQQPWFTPGEQPNAGSEGQYYITYEKINEEKYETQVFKYEDGVWVDRTEDTFGQLVNQDIEDSEFGYLYDVDIEQVLVSRSNESSYGTSMYTDARYGVSVSDSNCYNAIMDTAKKFDLYPVFDCINKTVTLKLNVGKDYGLVYRYKTNLKNSHIKIDGDKVITKLYVTGGMDSQGSRNINIGEATRSILANVICYFSHQLTDGDFSHLRAEMEKREKNAYDNLMGVPLTIGTDMQGRGLKLLFPDNLYELVLGKDIPVDGTKKKETLVKFNNGHSIELLFNPTGADWCFYIYENTGDSNYKDETKQLYKFSCPDVTLRRNLTEYKVEGSITEVNTSLTDSTGIKVSSYIKDVPPLLPEITKEKEHYTGTVLEIYKDAYCPLEVPKDRTTVFKGPERVYIVPKDKDKVYTYTLGNVYYRELTDTYCFVAGVSFGSGGDYTKIKNIAISGYGLIEIGHPNDPVVVQVGDKNAHIIKLNGQKMLLKELFKSGTAIRVTYDGTNVIEKDEFAPNNQEFLVGRSPYGESYIYNFKYLYDNHLMTKEQILDIYRVSEEISDANLEFYDKYGKELEKTRALLYDAFNNYDLYSSKADAQLEALMSQYWINPNRGSLGQFSAFPGLPSFSSGRPQYDSNKKMYYEDITYDKPMENGQVQTSIVKRVYFNVFGTPECLSTYPHCEDNKTVSNNPYAEGQYHVVAKALGWEANSEGVLTINKLIGPYSETQDPSKTADSYNNFVDKMKEYYFRAQEAENNIKTYSDKIEDLSKKYEIWQETIRKKEKYIQENYGQYIIEGSYNNEDQPYSNLLLEAGLEASDKYASPDVTYNVGVVDASGLIEYRAPQLYQYDELVKKMHNIGQIAPHVGDYVAIQDEPMGMFGVPGLITTINRRIDDPYQNSITIDTSYSDADELVGNIITATNTILSNKDIYGRAAIINNKGQLSSTTVNDALSSGRNSISIISTNGKVVVDDNGLTCVNPKEQNHSLRYNGTGILATDNNGITWREMMTPYGINANYLNAGSINASKVSITDGGNDITVLNGRGLIVKENANQPYQIGALSENGSDSNWKNVTVFVGRDQNNHGVGYFNGYINASKGGNIGGWIIKPDGLYNAANNAYLTPNAKDNILKITDKFYVESNGVLHATGAKIDGSGSFSGKLVITDDSSELNKGTIAGFTANDGGLTGSVDVIKLSPAGITGVVNGHEDKWVIYSKGNFGVTIEGKLYATGADIKGKITATSGIFDNCTINSSCNVSGASIDELSADKIKTGTMSANRISGGTLNITTSGGGYLKAGVGTTNPEVSGINVGEKGVLFGKQAANTSIDGDSGKMILTYGGESITMQANGGDPQFVLETAGLTMKSMTNLEGGMKIKGHLGPTAIYKVLNNPPADFIWMKFIDGVLVKVYEHDPAKSN